MLTLLKRSWNLIRIGKAALEVRHSTDQEKKERAHAYLMELLGKSRGLPTKIGQFLSMNGETPELAQTVHESVPAIPFSEVEEILHAAYDGDYTTVFKKVFPEGKPASLGQVHRARLKSGEEVAVKVQYPEIQKSVEAELRLLGLLPEGGPVKRWGFAWEEYGNAFRDHLNHELDYDKERQQQERYRERIAPIDGLVVPGVWKEWCRPNVLVQDYEIGLSMEEAEQLPPEDRSELGRILLRHYLHMLFHHGVVHSDPNPGNFAFRVNHQALQVVLYDYGSVFEVSEQERTVLLKIILGLQQYEDLDPAACLVALGFEVEKLRDLRHCLGALLSVLFEPFLVDGPYHVKDWDINRRFESIVGELKWWFRSAAPPRMIFLMRTLHGLANHLRRLDARLSWKSALREVAENRLEAARNYTLPVLPEEDRASVSFRGMARYLKVDVKKGPNNRVVLTMPARVVDDLDDLIDPAVKESIRKHQIDLGAIQKQIQQSGYVPQVLFDLEDEVRKVRVWLE